MLTGLNVNVKHPVSLNEIYRMNSSKGNNALLKISYYSNCLFKLFFSEKADREPPHGWLVSWGVVE